MNGSVTGNWWVRPNTIQFHCVEKFRDIFLWMKQMHSKILPNILRCVACSSSRRCDQNVLYNRNVLHSLLSGSISYNLVNHLLYVLFHCVCWRKNFDYRTVKMFPCRWHFTALWFSVISVFVHSVFTYVL